MSLVAAHVAVGLTYESGLHGRRRINASPQIRCAGGAGWPDESQENETGDDGDKVPHRVPDTRSLTEGKPVSAMGQKQTCDLAYCGIGIAPPIRPPMPKRFFFFCCGCWDCCGVAPSSEAPIIPPIPRITDAVVL
jgi:hypothetical protein